LLHLPEADSIFAIRPALCEKKQQETLKKARSLFLHLGSLVQKPKFEIPNSPVVKFIEPAAWGMLLLSP